MMSVCNYGLWEAQCACVCAVLRHARAMLMDDLGVTASDVAHNRARTHAHVHA